jgi:hypothetical protein
LPEFFAEIALIAQIRIASKTVGFAGFLLQIALHCDRGAIRPWFCRYGGIVLFSAAKSTRQALSG